MVKMAMLMFVREVKSKIWVWVNVLLQRSVVSMCWQIWIVHCAATCSKDSRLCARAYGFVVCAHSVRLFVCGSSKYLDKKVLRKSARHKNMTGASARRVMLNAVDMGYMNSQLDSDLEPRDRE